MPGHVDQYLPRVVDNLSQLEVTNGKDENSFVIVFCRESVARNGKLRYGHLILCVFSIDMELFHIGLVHSAVIRY